MTRPFALALAASLMPAALMAETPQPLPMSYQMFETAVPHVDLAVCPVPLAGPDRFCRLTTHSEGLNVFVFSEDGDQPMIGFQSWSAGLLVGLMD